MTALVINCIIGNGIFGIPAQLTRLLGRASPIAMVVGGLAMAVIAVALTVFGWSLIAVTVLLAFWGLIGTAAPVGWWTWMSKVLPDDTEAGGGLMVAVIQLAITLGASLGGLLFDGIGYRATFGASAMTLGLSAVVAVIASRHADVGRNWADRRDSPILAA